MDANQVEEVAEDVVGQTRSAIILSSLIHEPLAFLYIWLPFIFRKDLGATVFQISLLATLKPVISIVSFYWNSYNILSLRHSIILSGLLARIPFLLFPFFDSIWYFVFASTVYMLFSRASMPPWMEILKLNLDKGRRQRYFALGSVLSYIEGAFIFFYVGLLCDVNPGMWKILFALFAAFSMIGVFIQAGIPIAGGGHISQEKQARPTLFGPWMDTIRLMKERPDFAHFQIGFMASGFGIMVVAAIVPEYFADILQLTHQDFANARNIFMGLGFVICSPLWGKMMARFSLFKVTSLVFVFCTLFPVALILAKFSIYFLYAAYIIYGFAQSGSHMIWHLSGPIFAKNEDSAKFSGINIVMVGLRGLVAPMMAGWIYASFGWAAALGFGCAMCLFGSWFMMFRKIPAVNSEAAS